MSLKMFPHMLVKTTASEESRFPSQHRSPDPTWSRKRKDNAGGKERFFVGQMESESHAFATDAKAEAFALLY
jgi:hypothetical protein